MEKMPDQPPEYKKDDQSADEFCNEEHCFHRVQNCTGIYQGFIRTYRESIKK